MNFTRIYKGFYKCFPCISSLVPISIIVIISLISATLPAQVSNIRFDRIMSENTIKVKGLSQNTVHCILQDSRGFIWIGTWDGLNKYDGYSFRTYNMEAGLSNTTIHCLLEDNEGNLWVGTDIGLNRIDLATEGVTVFRHDTLNSNTLCDDYINNLFMEDADNLWISTANGLSKYSLTRKVFSTYNFYNKGIDSTRTNFITDVIGDGKGSLWIASYFGMHQYNPVSGEFKPVTIGVVVSAGIQSQLHHITDLYFDEKGILWIATGDGLLSLDPASGNWKQIDASKNCRNCLSSNTINTIWADSAGLVWIGTDNFLNIYDPEKDSIAWLRSSGNNTSLSNDDIRYIYGDKSGTIWIGTYRGLNKVDRSPSLFTNYRHIPGEINSLTNNIIYSVIEDRDGLVWIGTYGGVNILDRNTDKFKTILNNPGDPNSLSSDYIRVVLQDNKGYYWFGTETSGLNRYDPKTGKFRLYSHDPLNPSSLLENNILCMKEDSKGRIWVGTGKGVDILDPETGLSRHFTNRPESPLPLTNNIVWTIYEDRQGNIWIGTTIGLNKIDPGLNSIQHFRNEANNPASLSSNRVFSIYEDKEGLFWIGTMGGGLNRLDPATGKFKSYREEQGLANDVVYATIEDEENSLWISTNKGLSKFNKLSETFVNYDVKDGLQGNEFNAGAYFKNKKGEIYFGGMNGFNVFHPEGIKINQTPPRIVITGFRIFNEPVGREFSNGDTIALRYSDNFFSFEFSALDYTNPAKNWYRYKLEDYDPDWITRDASRRYADYKKVAPGTYTFHVTGSNNDGIWNTEGISLVVKINPPWWGNWIFRVLFGLSLIVIAWLMVSQRFRILKRKHEVDKKMLLIEKQVFELEQKSLRLQMNPHFIFNSLNAIQSFVISKDTDKAVNYLALFSHLMRMILANSAQSYIPLKDEIKALTLYMDLEKLRFDNKFDYFINIDPRIDTEFVEIPPMLFQPYVENAIIHGLVHSDKHGRLDIILKLRKNSLFCVIQDNGIGRERASQIREQSGIKRQPRGMIITKERIDLLNKQSRKSFSVNVVDLKSENGEPAGTRVEIIVEFKET